MDTQKSDDEQDRAGVLLLAEDAIVNSIKLGCAGRFNLNTELVSPFGYHVDRNSGNRIEVEDALTEILKLATLCELDIERMCPINDRVAQPVRSVNLIWRQMGPAFTGGIACQ